MLDLTAFRRDLHAHPETGFELERTAARLGDALEAAGLEVTRGIGRAGLVATLRRGPDSTAIGFRADMDALPIREATNLPHQSKEHGKFHGCGHDGHATMLSGAPVALAADTALTRTIHFIFQPDEENGTGAAAMIADGLFERCPMEAIFGLYNMPGLELAHFATQPGPFCAFEDNFEIRVYGRGGHASMPEKGIDPIVAGAAIVTQLQTIVARTLPPSEHTVVSTTEFRTDGARNICPARSHCAAIAGGAFTFRVRRDRKAHARHRRGCLKRSQKTGQLARLYPKPLKGYENGEAPEFCRSV